MWLRKVRPMHCIITHRMSQAQYMWNVNQQHCHLFSGGRDVFVNGVRLCRLHLRIDRAAVLRQHLQRDRVCRDVLYAVHSALHDTQLGLPRASWASDEVDAFPDGHDLGLTRRAFNGISLPFDVARVQTVGLAHRCKGRVLASVYDDPFGVGDAKDCMRFHGGDSQGVAAP